MRDVQVLPYLFATFASFIFAGFAVKGFFAWGRRRKLLTAKFAKKTSQSSQRNSC
jgi:hypothetical protein